MNYNDMNVGMDFLNNPVMPGQPSAPTMPQQYPAYQMPRQPEPDPVVTSGKGLFTVIPDNETPKRGMALTSPDADAAGVPAKRQYNKKKKDEITTVDSQEIVRADGNSSVPAERSTMYNYAQTTMLLGDTLSQVDMLADELKAEFDNVMANRAMKNKYMILTNLSESMSQLLNTKTTIIREINNSITKAIDLDYKKEKDRKAAEAIANDDKYIMDLYNSFVNNPYNNKNAQTLGPSAINNTVNSISGTSIIRSPLAQANPAPDGVVDIGYINYLNRISPEQNAMYYEKDPNVKTAVIYDMSTGHKFFQVMNMATGQAIPNVSTLDDRFLEDTVIDLQNNIAKNSNLHETYPLVIINGNAEAAKNY